jgi:hypothetical protein
MESQKNNLNQEELYFKELQPSKVPEKIETQIDEFLFATEYRSEEAILRKFAFGYGISCFTILFFYHQMGAGFLNFDIGVVLNFLGPILKQLINSIVFNSLAVAAVLVLSFKKEELELLLQFKEKIVYGLTFFIWLFICMFGSEFTWAGAFLWLIGAFFGAGIGLNFGIKFIQEKL